MESRPRPLCNYVDTDGPSVVGFAFTELLGFKLLPRLKNIGSIRLYRSDDTTVYEELGPMLTRPIRWELIAQQYDQIGEYATALRLGTAESDRKNSEEINSWLQVVENWNSANTVVFYGKDSPLTGADREHAEVSMLALHLLQSAMVHINTLLLQAVWRTRSSTIWSATTNAAH
ncbi:transposase [Nocardia amikacinitolerans]|uniref:transposase n=1 Tax=Nocardia amikacinitolerans TaxID=756689 RepID=UPI0020A44601|nr:transposase [Nocardia amikacinitolerans]MCP2280946.1 Tn3 transposase DDE domain-containing protein [Nocardia amikacinitolerans]